MSLLTKKILHILPCPEFIIYIQEEENMDLQKELEAKFDELFGPVE